MRAPPSAWPRCRGVRRSRSTPSSRWTDTAGTVRARPRNGLLATACHPQRLARRRAGALALGLLVPALRPALRGGGAARPGHLQHRPQRHAGVGADRPEPLRLPALGAGPVAGHRAGRPDCQRRHRRVAAGGGRHFARQPGADLRLLVGPSPRRLRASAGACARRGRPHRARHCRCRAERPDRADGAVARWACADRRVGRRGLAMVDGRCRRRGGTHALPADLVAQRRRRMEPRASGGSRGAAPPAGPVVRAGVRWRAAARPHGCTGLLPRIARAVPARGVGGLALWPARRHLAHAAGHARRRVGHGARCRPFRGRRPHQQPGALVGVCQCDHRDQPAARRDPERARPRPCAGHPRPRLRLRHPRCRGRAGGGARWAGPHRAGQPQLRAHDRLHVGHTGRQALRRSADPGRAPREGEWPCRAVAPEARRQREARKPAAPPPGPAHHRELDGHRPARRTRQHDARHRLRHRRQRAGRSGRCLAAGAPATRAARGRAHPGPCRSQRRAAGADGRAAAAGA